MKVTVKFVTLYQKNIRSKITFLLHAKFTTLIIIITEKIVNIMVTVLQVTHYFSIFLNIIMNILKNSLIEHNNI